MTHVAPGLTDVMDGALSLVRICESDLELTQALGPNPVALAVIVGTQGPSYRPIGATMAIATSGQYWGSLSSGCIDRDVIVHAQQALSDGQGRRLRYGQGSPFQDLVLPCGGGLDVLILPNPPRASLQIAADRLRARQAAVLELGPLRLQIEPELRFVVLGKGPEMLAFSALALAAGYPVEVASPDPELAQNGAPFHHLHSRRWPEDLALDHRTAVTLFFHEHDWEPPLLAAALTSPALYVGAQGSLRAHHARVDALLDLGLAPDLVAELASPFGLVPSARDARMLAASVLAQVLERARLL
ncbi:XdhC family protein [Paracoccus sp. (in: a-proteobacteria)]|uniref:XdhC family protein n=1 Tax=Paracoccus sp. TaxID=267 RepID=UPI002897746F|nr:XdhC family protein [Paracoccus sp. (in: a-proteobacteria)]